MHTKREFDRSRGAGMADKRRDSNSRSPAGGERVRKTERSAEQFLPDRITLGSLRAAADSCRGCDLYQHATQAVFGEGRRDAALVFVGEQPGDQEDRAGRPFVGPAGRLLAKALQEAGIARESVYITNAVKHFKWVPRGKRRLHQRPREGEIDACNPWLVAELKVIKPRVLVCLGTTAARAALGRTVRLKDHRGKFAPTALCERTFVTIHPSAVLRLLDPDRAREYRQLVDDLQQLRVFSAH